MDNLLKSQGASENNWKLISNPIGNVNKPRLIINGANSIPNDAYPYKVFTPIVLAPINRFSTLILSEFADKDTVGNNRLGLRIHDMRLVDEIVTSSISFRLRGDQTQLTKFKNEMNRVADADHCVGISFLLRKLFYAGFDTIMAPKKIKRKENSPLRDAMSAITCSMANHNNQEDSDGDTTETTGQDSDGR